MSDVGPDFLRAEANWLEPDEPLGDCRDCDGTGEIVDKMTGEHSPCPCCRGTGRDDSDPEPSMSDFV